MSLKPDRRALFGALAGAATAVLGGWMAGLGGEDLPYTLLIVLAIALIGLRAGAGAATWAYFGGSAVLLATIFLREDPQLAVSDVIRLTAYFVGSPLIVYLVHRGEIHRRVAGGALAASQEARRKAYHEHEQQEAAHLELNAALVAAERERARLEEVAEAIPEPLVVYDDDLRGTYGNRAALRLFGRSFVERPLDEWGTLTEPRDEGGQPLKRKDWPQVRARKAAFRRRMIIRVPMSGRDAIVDVEGTPIPGGGAVLLLRDVAKEEDERQRLSSFASFVAHELRNPLAVAKARMELTQRVPDLPAKAAGHVLRASESVDAALGILERLELYSRADSGRLEAAREAFKLGPALGAAIERLRARGSEREVRVSMAPGIVIIGDRPLSEQAITNLLTNADRYSSPGTPIHVEVVDEEQVVLRVRDEGPGIDDKVAERLFHERVTGGQGLGLGLYLVNATMEAMEGSVRLEQRAPAAVFALRWERGDASPD